MALGICARYGLSFVEIDQLLQAALDRIREDLLTRALVSSGRADPNRTLICILATSTVRTGQIDTQYSSSVPKIQQSIHNTVARARFLYVERRLRK